MNPPVPSPEDRPLRSLLRDAHPTPALPPRFQEGVWRRIERADQREVPTSGPGVMDWIRMWFRPAPLAAALAIAALLGTWMGFRHGAAQSRIEERARYVASVDPFLRSFP